MSGSVRKHKFRSDLKEGTKFRAEIGRKIAWPRITGNSHLNGSNGPYWSDLEANDALSALKSNDSFEWPFWEPLPEYSGVPEDDDISEDFNGISESKRAWGADNRYRIRTSPDFNGRGQQSNRWSPKSSWRLSHRVRSRSWGRSRSRSPVYDFERESYGWSDRSRSGSEVLSKSCRDFAAGRCRRGDQCRFLHQDYLKTMDRWHSEIDLVESWGSRQEYRGASRYANTKGNRNYPRDKASNGFENFYDGERNELLRDSSRSTNHCNDFRKVKFHRGSSHRYVHHGASGDGYGRINRNSGDGYCRGNRNAPFDHDRKHEPHRSGDNLCKYFAMGNCRNGDYCRFSHDGHAHSNPKGRSRYDRRGHDLEDENRSWSGPKWNDSTAVSDIAKFTRWGDGDVGNVNFTDATAENFTYNRWGHSLDNENRSSGGPVRKDKAAKRDEHRSSHWGSGSSVNTGSPESMGVTKLSVKEEPPFIPRGSQSQTLNGISIPDREQNVTQEASSLQLAATVVHPTESESPYVLQHFSKRGNNNAITASSTTHNDVNFSGKIVHTVLVPGQSFKQDGDNLGSQPFSSVDETSQSQQTLSLNRSSGHTFDLNEMEQEIISPLNPQSQIQFHQGESVETPAMVESKVSRVTSGTPQNEVTGEQVTQITNFSVILAQVFENEQQCPHLNTALNRPSSTGSVPSLPNSASLSPPADSKAIQFNPPTWSQEQYDFVGDKMDSSKPDNSNQPPAFLSNPIEQQNQVPSGPSSSEFNKSDSSEEEHHENHKLKWQEPTANSETKENSRTVPDECKQEQEIGHSENLGVDGRVEEGNRNMDDKEMLIFKIALVESVKEILKPTWKEGRLSKEVHKTIVRKVVDKVIATIPGGHIPKTKENIDHYLSYSKPKITKLVQAYVEIYPKIQSDA